jgi:hypothetical protein
MRRLVLALAVSGALVGGCGDRAGPAPEVASPGPVITDVPTSPAGFSDQAPAGLLQAIVHWGRRFRGNPAPLGIVTGAVLLGALALGVYTLSLVGRGDQPGRSASSVRHSPRAE